MDHAGRGKDQGWWVLSLDVTVQANDLSFKREAVVKENEELKRRMSGVEEMVTNLIIDQQAMAKVFQECGDQHSGSLERHRADLNTARC